MTIEPIRPTAPEHVATPIMLARWSAVSFIHWAVEPAAVRPFVPDRLDLDVFDDMAWVGLVPFRMEMRPPIGPAIPLLSSYPETNVRTYVVDRHGRRGLWFLSLDVANPAAAAAGRLAFGLPYAWSTMSLLERPGSRSYRSERRFPAPGTRSSCVVATTSEAIDHGDLATFLTARFRLFGVGPLGPYAVAIEHAPWTLRRATVTTLDDELVARNGPRIDGPPDHVCVAEPLDVRVGPPRRRSR